MDMTPIPITWSLERKNILPIVYVSGISSSSIIEPVLLHQANKFIDIATQYKGRLIPDKPQHQEKVVIQISFSVIFPTEEDLKKFVKVFP